MWVGVLILILWGAFTWYEIVYPATRPVKPRSLRASDLHEPDFTEELIQRIAKELEGGES
jgi:hypothetical protein